MSFWRSAPDKARSQDRARPTFTDFEVLALAVLANLTYKSVEL